LAAVRARSFDDGVVVLEELRLLRVLERDEDHRVAAGGHHAPRQADHFVIVAADADAFAQLETGLDVGDGLVSGRAAGVVLPPDSPARRAAPVRSRPP
jgi:hypothetical protein